MTSVCSSDCSARSECCREGLPIRKHVVTAERMAMKRDVARER